MMHIFHSIQEWMLFRDTLSITKGLGFVPTMGNLHKAHASLFHISKEENEYTVSSLFINPTQFNRRDDFTKYPRTLDADLQLMKEAGVDFCILPEESEIYADGFNYQVHEAEVTRLMEGKYRPGHFNGVLTVVMKLLNITKPTRAYFGEKDYQQYKLIQAMVKAFFMNIEIKACPTIREPSSLAYSSRNNRLNAEQRIRAELFARIFHQNKNSEQIKAELEAAGIEYEYIEEYELRRFAAVLIDDIRLIDNYALSHDSD